MIKPPNPGSPEAQEMGCLCPVMDNHQGKGFRQNVDGHMLFWINGECPIHGANKGKTDEAPANS